METRPRTQVGTAWRYRAVAPALPSESRLSGRVDL